MASVRLEHIDKIFGSFKAVNDVNLEVNDGEFVALLGPSGCGKTTTLRMIAGLELPTNGKISIGSRDVTMSPARDRDIAMVFQDYALYPHMNVLDNIGYPLKVRGVPTPERTARVQDVANNLQIGKLLDRRPGQISGGQQQRASLARAVVHKAQVFLFDEPLSNLDAKLRVEARAFLKHLQREVGITSIYVTHDQAEALALADRIVVMREGRILQQGKALDVYREPANKFVAAFLGSPPMNLLDCTIDDNQIKIAGSDVAINLSDLAAALPANLPKNEEISLGIRPENITIHTTPTQGNIPAKLYVIQTLGGECLIITSIGNTLISVRLFEEEPPTLPDDLYLSFDLNRLFFFGADEQRIR